MRTFPLRLSYICVQSVIPETALTVRARCFGERVFVLMSPLVTLSFRDASSRRRLVSSRFLIATAIALATLSVSKARATDAPLARTVVHTSTLPPLPLALDGASAVATSGAIFVFGGESPRGLSSTLLRLDGRTGAATVVTDRLVARRDHQAVLLDEHTALVIGGRGRRGVESTVEIVRLDDGSVARGAPMPTPRASLGAALVDGRVVTAGGTLGWGKVANVEIYDVAADRWTRGAPLKIGRDGVLATSRGLVYMLGGESDRGRSALVERYDGGRFVMAPSLPRAMRGHRAVSLGDRVVLFGDADDPRRLTILDPVTRESETLRSAHTARPGACVVAVGARVVVIGGQENGRPSDLVEMLSFE